MKTLQAILARLRPAYHQYKHSLNELSFVAIWVVVYVSIAPVFRWIDPTARAFDAGTLQHLFYGVVGYFMLKLITHVDISWSHKRLNRYLNSPDIDTDFDECTPFQRIAIYLWRLSLGLCAMSCFASL